jgi:acetylornithine deacetylase
VNAIDAMLPLIAALRQYEREKNAGPHPAPYQEIAHPLNLNLGIIRAGDWPSSVPAESTLEGRFACLPGTPVAKAKSELKEVILKAARSDPWLREHPPTVEFFGFHAEPSLTDPAWEAMKALGDCHRSVVRQPLAFTPSTATTDQRFFTNDWNTPATAYGPVAEQIHAHDERVSISSIAKTARVMALFLARWCGVAE